MTKLIVAVRTRLKTEMPESEFRTRVVLCYMFTGNCLPPAVTHERCVLPAQYVYVFRMIQQTAVTGWIL